MKKIRKKLGTAAALGMFLILGFSVFALAFHNHLEADAHVNCAVCSAQQVLSTALPCLILIVLVQRAISTVTKLQKAKPPLPPAVISNSSRSPPLSFPF